MRGMRSHLGTPTRVAVSEMDGERPAESRVTATRSTTLDVACDVSVSRAHRTALRWSAFANRRVTDGWLYIEICALCCPAVKKMTAATKLSTCQHEFERRFGQLRLGYLGKKYHRSQLLCQCRHSSYSGRIVECWCLLFRRSALFSFGDATIFVCLFVCWLALNLHSVSIVC